MLRKLVKVWTTSSSFHDFRTRYSLLYDSDLLHHTQASIRKECFQLVLRKLHLLQLKQAQLQEQVTAYSPRLITMPKMPSYRRSC